MPGYTLPLTESRIIADLMKRQHGQSSALVGGATGVRVEHQEFVVTDTTVTSYQLTYTPVDNGVWLELNGVTQREGTDYTCDYSTGTITTSMTLHVTPAPADVLMARYITTGDAAAGGGTAPVGASEFFGISGNKAVINPGSASGSVGILDLGTPVRNVQADITVSATAAAQDGVVLLGIAQPDGYHIDDYFALLLTPPGGPNGLLLRCAASGTVGSPTETVLNSGFQTVTAGATYTVRLEYDPTTGVLTGKVNGSAVTSYTLTSAEQTKYGPAHLAGLRMSQHTDAAADNFTANGGTASDSFNRADTTSGLGVADTGQAWVE